MSWIKGGDKGGRGSLESFGPWLAGWLEGKVGKPAGLPWTRQEHPMAQIDISARIVGDVEQ
jgi:hypothetical protein